MELLATLKKSYSYRELSSVLDLSAPILSRYVRGHVLPSAARSEKFIATFREKLAACDAPTVPQGNVVTAGV